MNSFKENLEEIKSKINVFRNIKYNPEICCLNIRKEQMQFPLKKLFELLDLDTAIIEKDAYKALDYLKVKILNESDLSTEEKLYLTRPYIRGDEEEAETNIKKEAE